MGGVLGFFRSLFAGLEKLFNFLNTRELLSAGEDRNKLKAAQKQLELQANEQKIKNQPVKSKSDILDELFHDKG